MTNDTSKLISELNHLAESGCNGSDYTAEHHLASRAAVELERLTKVIIPKYKVNEFQPLMRFAEQEYSTLKRPLYEYSETFYCDDVLFKKGETTDFASIPFIVRMFAPQISMYVGAAAKHDKRCIRALELKSYRLWKEATDEFYADLIKCKTNETRAKAMRKGVYLNGLMLKSSGKLK